MARARDTRLAQLLTQGAGIGRPQASIALRSGHTTVRAVVGDRLAQSGIDRARVCALRRGDAADFRSADVAPHSNTLPASGARDQFEELAALDDDSLASIFAAKIGDMARRYQDGDEPDPTNASLAELFAWYLARSPRNASHAAGLTPPEKSGGMPANTSDRPPRESAAPHVSAVRRAVRDGTKK